MITINPQAADVITINISDADQITLNTTAIVLVEGGGSGGGDADTLQGENGAYYLSRANHTNTQAISTVTGLQTALDTLTDTDEDLQAQIDLKLDIADYNDRFLGLYASFFDLEAAHPTASAGDYAQVDLGIGSDVIVYAWDVSDEYWAAVGSSPIANTDALPEGSTNLYFTGQRVRDTPLTGLSTATDTPITAADSVLSAAGKLQGQASANATAIAGKLNTADAPATVRATALTGLSLATATPITATDTVLSAAGKLQAQISAISGGSGGMYIAGRYYSQAMNASAPPAAANRASDTLFFMPFLSYADFTISRFGFSPTALVAGARLKTAIYEVVGTNLVRVTESLDIDASAVVRQFFNQSFSFKAGKLYFFGFKTSVNRVLTTISLSAAPTLGSINGALLSENLQVSFLSQAGVIYAPDMPLSVDSSILIESSIAPTAIAFQVAT